MKWRVVVISLVVSLSMGMFVTGLYSALIFDHSMDTYIKETNFPDIFVTLSGPVNYSEADRVISGIDGIGSYQLRLKIDSTYHYMGEDYGAVIIGVRDPGREDINKLLLKDGEILTGPGEGVVVSGMEGIGAKVGKVVSFTTLGIDINVTVTGTVQSAEYIFASPVQDSSLPLPGNFVVLFMDLDELRNRTGLGVNDIILNVDNGKRDAIVNSLGALPVSEIVYQEDHPSVIFMEIGAGKMRNMFPLFSVIFMVVGVISIFMTFYRIVMNDSRYIGVLMALGYSRLRIVLAYLNFGFVLGTIGTVFGLIFGFIFTSGIMYFTMSMIGDIRVSYPLAPMPFVWGILFSFGSVLASVGIPILMITRRSVRQALDHKPKTKILTVGRSLPGLSKTRLMGIRNTFRNPGRTVLTVLVVGMSIGISGSWIVVSESAWGYMQSQVEQDTWDLRADLTRPLPNDEVRSMFKMEEAEYVVPFAYLAGQLSGGGGRENTFVVTSDEILKTRDFELESGRLDVGTSVITNKLADELGLSTGDMITVTVGSNSLSTTVGGIVYDILMQAVYLDREAASPLINETLATGAFIKLVDKDMSEEIARELKGIDGVSGVTIQDDIIRSMDETFGSAMGLLYFFFIICLIIAMVVAASAIIISTMERDIEFATLETLGIQRSKVIGSMLIEIAIIGLFSALLGVPFAYLYGRLFAVVMQEILYYFPVVFAFTAMAMTFVFGFLFIFGSSIFPIRYTGKMDVEKTIRERITG
ncbi:MAG: FtsX-like permease family protein [Thermoplasmatota archaeon]